MFDLDWNAMWTPTVPLLEIFIRGTAVYLALFVYFRALRREAGGIGVSDVLVVVLIADASQNAMAGEYASITEGLFLVATIGFWDFVLDWLGFRFQVMERVLRPAPLLLVSHGRLMRQNMRKEMITEDELRSLLREQGIEDLGRVRRCFLEGDGHLSVIPGGSKRDEPPGG